MRKQIPQADRISILRAAINGDFGAQQILLDYFDGYINTMSTITLYALGGSDGGETTYLDEDFKIQIQCKLLKSLGHFDLDGILSKNSKHRNAKAKIPCKEAWFDD